MRQIYDTDIGIDEYQTQALKTVTYPDYKNNLLYPTLGLCGEAGEIAEKIKKLWRDKNVTSRSLISTEDIREIVKELGDVLWYIAAIASELDIPLSNVASENISKLASRKERDKIKGSGDNR